MLADRFRLSRRMHQYRSLDNEKKVSFLTKLNADIRRSC
ncbi:MAG: hypothetical protein ACI96W_004024, partial [Paraglaciecola sp.]